MNDDPKLAAFLRRMAEQHEVFQGQIRALNKRTNSLISESQSDKMEIQRLQKELKKAAERIRYVEDIPGKRVPYTMNFEINIPGPTTPSVSVAGQRLSDTKQVSMDGPFVCTSYMSAFLMKTFSVGPYGDESAGRPNDPPAGTEIITPLSGRFRPVASTADPFAGAYIGPDVGPLTIAGAQAVQTFRPGAIDFLYEIADEGVDRLRQNQVPTPSRYLYSEFDRPNYLPVTDFFERGSSIRFSATLTRDLGFAEVNSALLPNGYTEVSVTPPPNPNLQGDIGRMVVAIGGTLYFSMVGYKILQAQSPAV
jgi:hypothetical protein